MKRRKKRRVRLVPERVLPKSIVIAIRRGLISGSFDEERSKHNQPTHSKFFPTKRPQS